MAVKGEKRNFTCMWAGVRPTEEDIKQILADHKIWVVRNWDKKHKKRKDKNDDPPHDFGGANLKDANLVEVHLEGANLMNANCEKGDFWGIDLQGASLKWASCRKTKLWGAGLEAADLRETDLRNANLQAARLDQADVMGVMYNRKTVFKAIRLGNCYGSPMFRRFAQDQEILEELQERKWKNWKWGKQLYWLWLIFADCGRTPWVWLAWSIGFILIFAFLFTTWNADWPVLFKDTVIIQTSNTPGIGVLLPESLIETLSVMADSRPAPISFWTALYFSVVTFTTLGFGDVVAASGWARFFVGLEVVIGYVMLGGLISFLASTIFRRS